jgi:hypothetical protein
MSKATDADQDPEGWDSLRDVFHKEITANGGDSAKAFIATLDELDARIGVSDDQIARNSQLLDTLVKWLTLTNDRLKEIPGQIEKGTERGASRLSTAAERAATKGAREGAAPSYAALEALRQATEAYEARKRRITRLAVLGLPLAFSAALLTAFLFASFVIPALPQGWQWPCKVIGAEFRPNIDPEKATTFCVIVRE